MKKLHIKLLQHRKVANKRACLSYRNSEGKPYSTHHYTEDREMSWCDVAFKRGKKVFNCTFLDLSAVIDVLQVKLRISILSTLHYHKEKDSWVITYLVMKL